MKKAALLFLLLVLLPVLSLPVRAEDENPFSALLDALPEDVRAELPEDCVSEMEKGENADGAVLASLFSLSDWKTRLLSAVKSAFSPLTSTFSAILAALIVSSAVGHAAGEGERTGLSSFLSLFFAVFVWRRLGGEWDAAIGAVETMTVFLRAVIPALLGLEAASGGIVTASAGEASLLAVPALIGEGAAALTPVIRGMTALALIGALTDDGGGEGMLGTVGRTVSGVLAFLTALLGLFLSGQRAVAAGTDGMLNRTVRFAVGNFVPYVGGAAGESVSVMIGSALFLKSAMGGVGAAVVLFIVLKPTVSLLLTRIALSLSVFAAGLLGDARAKKLLSGFSAVTDLTAAALFTATVLSVFLFSLFVKNGQGVIF